MEVPLGTLRALSMIMGMHLCSNDEHHALLK